MALRLKKWRNPTTLDVRIYLNGHDLRGKVWLEKDAAGGCRVAADDASRLDTAKDLLAEVLEDMDLSLGARFADIAREATW